MTTTAAAPATIHLTHNELPWSPTPKVRAALQDVANQAHRYPTADDENQLRQALADYHEVPSESIVLGAGAAGLLELIMRTCVADGAEVVVPWRSWEAYPDIIDRAGGTFVPVPLGPGVEVDLESVAEAITSRTAVVLLTHPHNPTGQALGREQWRRFLRRVPAGVLVVLDEAYYEFLDTKERSVSADGIATVREGDVRVLALRTFSKAHGLAGLRVGYAVANPALAADLRHRQLPFGVNLAGLRAAHAALLDGGARAGQLCVLRAERDRLAGALAELGWPSLPSAANMLWLPARGDAQRFAVGVRKHGIVVRCWPGEGIRISVGTRIEGDALLDAVRDLGD